jgi:3-dehydroquinate synthase
MTQITLKLRSKPKNTCKIFIQKGIIDKLPEYLKENKIGEKYAIITDSSVKKLFGEQLSKKLKKRGIKNEIISFEKGENSKNLSTIEKLAEEMIAKNFDRKDAILSIGGGVTGDMAGFLSSIYMRGIPYIQIPTTLMAMIDSSIGGKTGVDLHSGKNLLGTTKQPKAVFVDINYLKNLPEKEIKNGISEAVKYGIIKHKSLFNFIERNIEKIFNKDEKTLKYIIEKSIKTKVKIVEEDENDKGKRIILNYGHTYGHALEKLSGYKLLHGFALSIGMVLANKIAVKNGLLKEKEAERIKNLLKKSGLPVTTIKKITKKDILSDKKREGNYIKMVLPKKIGKVIIYKEKCQ